MDILPPAFFHAGIHAYLKDKRCWGRKSKYFWSALKFDCCGSPFRVRVFHPYLQVEKLYTYRTVIQIKYDATKVILLVFQDVSPGTYHSLPNTPSLTYCYSKYGYYIKSRMNLRFIFVMKLFVEYPVDANAMPSIESSIAARRLGDFLKADGRKSPDWGDRQLPHYKHWMHT